MENARHADLKPTNSYVEHFNKAQENFQQVCQEYGGTSLCQKARRYRRVMKTISNINY